MDAALQLGRVVATVGLGLVAAGALTPAEATIGSDPCPAGTELVAKFEVVGQGYVFERPMGNEGLVTLEDATLDGGSWTATVDIAAVVVKGGSGDASVDVDRYDPPVRAGTFDNAELLNPGGNVPDISFVAFCSGVATTTTSGGGTTTSTTSGGETTTTTLATTTTSTTAPSTTTTEVGAATTSTTTGATVLPTQLTATTGPSGSTTSTTAEVLGVQLARTGGDGALLRWGGVLLLVGAGWELAARRARRNRPA